MAIERVQVAHRPNTFPAEVKKDSEAAGNGSSSGGAIAGRQAAGMEKARKSISQFRCAKPEARETVEGKQR